jgi:hypothetical protein
VAARKVEVGDGLAGAEAGAADALRDIPLLTPIQLVLAKQGEELGSGQQALEVLAMSLGAIAAGAARPR